MEKQKKSEEIVKENPHLFLHFLKANFPVFHNSNIFFRDIQFGIKRFLEKKNINLTSAESEKTANNVTDFFEAEGIFVKVNNGTFRLNFPDFVTTAPGDPL